MKKFWLGSFVLASIVTASIPAHAQFFSVASFPPFSGGTSPSGLAPDAILIPGPIVILPGAGPVIPPFIGVDAIDFGRLGITGFSTSKVADYEFSVSSFSVGPVGIAAVGAEAFFTNATADIFSSDGAGSNILLYDGDGIPAPGVGLKGSLGLPEAAGPPSEDLDAWVNKLVPPFYGRMFYSVDTASAAAAYGAPPFSGADVFFTPFIPPYDVPSAAVPAPPFFAVIYAPAPALFLDLVGGPNSDDIDALVVLDDGDFLYTGALGVDTVLFSLSPFSPALGGPGPYAGASPADILFANSAGAAGVFLPASALGLLPGADLDALDIAIKPAATSVTMTNSLVTVTWADLDPPLVYTVAVESTSAPQSWGTLDSFTSSAPSYVWTDLSPTNANLKYRIER